MKSRSEMMHTDSLSTSKPPPSPIGSNTTLNHIPLSGPESINETSLPDRNQSMWSRMLRHFTIQSPIIHRLLPKIKSGRLLLELNDQSQWKHFEVVLAGSNIGDLGLYYYANKTDQAPVGCILLHSAHIDVLEEIVMVVTQTKTWFLCAAHGREASDWAEAICAAIESTSQGVLSQGSQGQVLTTPTSLQNSTGSLSGTNRAPVGSKRRRLSGNASAVTVREIQRRQPRARVDEFLEIFLHSNAEDIRLQAMEGALSWSCMRSVTWKLWLEYLPSELPFSEWVPSTRTKRGRYVALRKQYCPFLGITTTMEAQQAFISACDTSEDVLLYAIYKDVRRTRGTMEFFRDPGIQCLLMRVLYTYSRAHPEISYNQGMGELLATLVYLLHVEQWPTSESSKHTTGPHVANNAARLYPRASLERGSTDSLDSEEYVYVESFIDLQGDATYLDREHFLQLTPFTCDLGKYSECCRDAVETILQEITSPTSVEHDSYLLLEEIMFRMAGAYCPEVLKSPTSHPNFRRPSSFTVPPSGSMDVINTHPEWISSPLYDQMNNIHNQILGRCDPPTARHLATLGVEPQMFVLRWVRVLMSREYEMVHVWQIWDAIFSLTPSDFSFINLLCVAAVREFREEILQVQDPTGVLLCLRDLSEKVQADRLVDNARELHDALMIATAVEATNSLE